MLKRIKIMKAIISPSSARNLTLTLQLGLPVLSLLAPAWRPPRSQRDANGLVMKRALSNDSIRCTAAGRSKVTKVGKGPNPAMPRWQSAHWGINISYGLQASKTGQDTRNASIFLTRCARNSPQATVSASFRPPAQAGRAQAASKSIAINPPPAAHPPAR